MNGDCFEMDEWKAKQRTELGPSFQHDDYDLS